MKNCLLGFGEAWRLFLLVKKTKKIKGDLAEVGVYKGRSAKIICLAKGARPLYLFDTFKGLPSVDYSIDPAFLYKGLYAASFFEVKKYLKKYKNVYYYKGLFPQTAGRVKNRKFSLVHLDCDTYKSTKASLEFFYPRMNRGGVIVSHDYFGPAKGVAKAFDEYFQDKQEILIKMPGSQCMITKL
ncbi:class I SAM-dependent methyltransferase [Microgenomates group bacterium]|nr:class I SAM-dependent methyltransferase [Microgenomates group bacterium]